MKILNVLNYSPEFGGGIVQHLVALGRISNTRGHKLFLGFPKKNDWQNDLMVHSDVVIIPEIENALWSGFPEVIRKFCLSNSIDILHIHFTFAQAFSLAFSIRKWEIPTIYHWHNPPIALNEFLTPPKNFRGLMKRFFSFVIARVTDSRVIDQHISMSKEITELLIKNKWTTQKKITFQPNGVWPTVSHKTTPEVNTTNTMIIGTVANFRPQKDHETLLNAFSILIKSGLNCELWIVGDGPTRPQIVKLADELNIESQVRFLGTISNPAEVYKRFDIFVLSTHYEGHPLVILEAMSFGIPIVATRISSIPEVITDRVNGLLVNPNDPRDLAKALEEILTNKSLHSRLSQAAQKSFQEQVSVDVWANNVISLYERVLNEMQIK
jgi:glycosyltransferase involved in cell wall biosynthesis